LLFMMTFPPYTAVPRLTEASPRVTFHPHLSASVMCAA
jgi:hypothetical protein